jgi:hypothetical protein
MGRRFDELSETHIRFIAAQNIFFVGTATANSRVNVSPKGMCYVPDDYIPRRSYPLFRAREVLEDLAAGGDAGSP